MKFPIGMVLDIGGGHHTCTPGNHPGKWHIKNNVCGIYNLDPVFVLPSVGPAFKNDEPQVTWRAGTVVDVEVKYLLNHAGSYQFRLCLDGTDTDECFNETPLKFEDGEDWHWIETGWLVTSMLAPTFTGKGKYRKDRVVIPDWVECRSCSLNWRWDCALEASVFSNCADVTILASDDPSPDPEPYRPQVFNFMIGRDSCLDIPGDNAAAGQPLWTWDCSGEDNQEFIFADDSWKITAANNPDLCLDAGDMSAGNSISLVECNGGDQQVFGYDTDASSIYLANSASDATMCLSSDAEQGSAVTLSFCDNEDSAQHWELSATSSRLQAFSNQTHAEWI
jgi:hypothetical protein